MSPYLALSVAIVAEVCATTVLNASNGFSQPLPVGIALLGYTISFYFLSQTLGVIPIGVAYAIWSGAGVVLITLVGWLFLKQHLDIAAIVGMTLIVSGVLVINLVSKTTVH